MKRTIFVIIISFFCMFIAACEKCSKQESIFEASVTNCRQGIFHPDDEYLALANSYLAQGNMVMWNNYMALANTNGYYDYNITFSVNGIDHTIIRTEPYTVGENIVLTEIKTYKGNELLKTEYR